MNGWDGPAEHARLELIRAGDVVFRTGDRVRLRPRASADILDMALASQTATIESIEQDFESRIPRPHAIPRCRWLTAV